MRIAYVSNPPSDIPPSGEGTVQRILASRGQSGLLALDLALLHSFPVADGWRSFFNAVQKCTSLTDDIREIAICRVAIINEAWYQLDGHKNALLTVEGFCEEKMAVVETLNPKDKGPLTERQWLVVRYADAMTKSVKIEDGLFSELRDNGFSDKGLMELTVTIAAYNCVSRFLVALDIGERNK